MPPTNSGSTLQDWKEVLSGVFDTVELDTSGYYETSLQLQAAIAAVGAHVLGTRFIVQVSSKPSGDEDWANYGGEFIDLAGTISGAAGLTSDAAQGTNTLVDSSDNTAPVGAFLLIEDPTLAASEIAMITALATGTISILDPTTTAHSSAGGLTKLWDVATSRDIKIQGTNILRARLITDNSYDSSGQRILYKLSETHTSAL